MLNEIIKKIEEEALNLPPATNNGDWWVNQEDVLTFLRSAIKSACLEYARSVVPKEEKTDIYRAHLSFGFNACRAETLSKIKEDENV